MCICLDRLIKDEDKLTLTCSPTSNTHTFHKNCVKH